MTNIKHSRRRMLQISASALAATTLAAPWAAAMGRREPKLETVTTGLRFPEGCVEGADGAIYVSEIAEGRITRIEPDGRKEVVARPGGGPNGLAFGPDGWLYGCNGGGFNWVENDGMLLPVGMVDGHKGGWIERSNPKTGEVQVLYEAVDGRRLSSPNDLIFDRQGGFWFTDTGASHSDHQVHGRVFYARADGSEIIEAQSSINMPNGIGLSPDGSQLYVALTSWRDLRAFQIDGPGQLSSGDQSLLPGSLIKSFDGDRMIDSLAVEANGNICVAVFLNNPGIGVVAPDGTLIEHVPMPDLLTTNICFGGPDMKTAYVTQSAGGTLLKLDWVRAGLRPAYYG